MTLETVLIFSMLSNLIMILVCLILMNYYLYKYLLEKQLVKNYLDFNSYVYGRKNWKKYKIIWDRQHRHDVRLKKAKLFLILYYIFIFSLFCILFLIIYL